VFTELENRAMKFWMGAEVQADIADDFRPTRQRIESVLNLAIEGKEYGSGMLAWDIIPMIFGEIGPSWYKEVERYHKRDKSVEFRLKIGHDEFKFATQEVRCELVAKALLRSLDLMEEMNIPDFDLPALRRDFLAVSEREGWLPIESRE
jgi:hypothetical protein